MGNAFAREEIDFNGEIELRHFHLLRCVGKGAFGKVRIVEKRDTKQLYALKYINKHQCIKMRAIPNIFRERSILEELHHPFMVNLRFAFQDDENMFMVMDLMMGGDLRFHLDRLGGFSENQVRFFAMELVSAIDYLHKKAIVHRDLKPDNILLDERGHVHITDFNIAVHFEDKVLRSQSGTLAYMAPEVFAGKGYTWTVDWWSLGVVLYECLYGKRPFRGNDEESLKMVIQTGILQFPPTNYFTKHVLNLSPECLGFLTGLLQQEMPLRLGCGRMGVEEIQAHPFFRGIDWDKVDRAEYPPQFVPDPEKANFDATYELEELLLEDNPLTYRPRKKKAEQKQQQQQQQQQQSAPGLDQTTPSKPRRNSFNVLSRLGGGRHKDADPGKERKLSAKDRLQRELDYIDRHFKIFDSSMYDRYKGLADPDKLCATDDVPSWVTNLDQKRKSFTTQVSDGVGVSPFTPSHGNSPENSNLQVYQPPAPPPPGTPPPPRKLKNGSGRSTPRQLISSSNTSSPPTSFRKVSHRSSAHSMQNLHTPTTGTAGQGQDSGSVVIPRRSSSTRHDVVVAGDLSELGRMHGAAAYGQTPPSTTPTRSLPSAQGAHAKTPIGMSDEQYEVDVNGAAVFGVVEAYVPERPGLVPLNSGGSSRAKDMEGYAMGSRER